MARIISSGNTLFSPENYEKRKRERKRKFIFGSATLFALLVLFVLASRVERFQISEIKVEGARVITGEEIARSVRETLSGYYAWLVPRGNLALYPRPALRNNLMKEFPRLSSVSSTLTGTALNVLVTERDPFALYCADIPEPTGVSSCYFLDEQGFIFDEAPDFSGSVYLIYSSVEPIEEPKGKIYLPAATFQSLSGLVERLPALGVAPQAVQAGEREFNLRLENGARIIWLREADPEMIYANLSAFFREVKKTDPNFLNKVSLLDMRTENKVFYRFK